MSTLTGTRSRQKGPSPAEWAEHRQELESLYINWNCSLPQINKHMVENRGFHATPKMYKTQFKKWALRKYKNELEMKAAEWRRRQPDRRGKASIIEIGQTTYNDIDIDEYFRRRPEYTGHPPSEIGSPSPEIRMNIRCFTPDLSLSLPVRIDDPHDASIGGGQHVQDNDDSTHQGYLIRQPSGSQSPALQLVLSPSRRLKRIPQSQSPQWPLTQPNELGSLEVALFQSCRLLDCVISQNPQDALKSEVPRLDCLIDAFNSFQGGSIYWALMCQRRACVLLEQNKNPFDLSETIYLYRLLAYFSQAPEEALFFQAFLKHLVILSEPILGPSNPIQIIVNIILVSKSRAHISYRILELGVQKIAEYFGLTEPTVISKQIDLIMIPAKVSEDAATLYQAEWSLRKMLQEYLDGPYADIEVTNNICYSLTLILVWSNEWNKVAELDTEYEVFTGNSDTTYWHMWRAAYRANAWLKLNKVEAAETILFQVLEGIKGNEAGMALDLLAYLGALFLCIGRSSVARQVGELINGIESQAKEEWMMAISE